MNEIILSKVSYAQSTEFICYDIGNMTILRNIVNYGLAMKSRMLSTSTIEQELRHLVELENYLRARKLKIDSLNDENLALYRDNLLKKTISARSHRGVEEKSKITVNAKLRRIYHWLHWLQSSGMCRSNLIGPRGSVRSEVRQSSNRSLQTSSWKAANYYSTPLCFRTSFQNSSHVTPRQLPTERTVDDLHAYFFASPSSNYLVYRNSLFIDIASRVGLRRGSINSLNTNQFLAEDIANSTDEFWITPSKQKKNYSNSFPIPKDLALQISSFIENQRAELIIKKRIKKTDHKGRIFLSERSGKPVTDRAMTQLIAKAMRSLGFEKGTSIHSFRGKFTSDAVDKEVETRLSAGMDTSSMSIAPAVAMRLGHKNPFQFLSYASAAQSKKARLERQEQESELSRLRSELNKLRRIALLPTPKTSKK